MEGSDPAGSDSAGHTSSTSNPDTADYDEEQQAGTCGQGGVGVSLIIPITVL